MKEWDYPKPKVGGLYPKEFRLIMLEIGENKMEYRLDVLIGQRRFRGEPYRGYNAEIFARRAAADLWKKMNVKANSS